MKIGSMTIENSMQIPQKKLKIVLPYDTAILLLDIYLKNTQTLIWKDTCTSMFIIRLLIFSQNVETAWVSIDRWMD